MSAGSRERKQWGGITYATLPLQNLRSLPRSHRTLLGHFRCSIRRDMSQSTLTLTPVSDDAVEVPARVLQG